MKKSIYLDYHATTPVDPQVFEAMRPYFTDVFGNATSNQHPFGWAANSAVEKAREQVASLIGAQPREIVFTSGATESIHLAILGAIEKVDTNKAGTDTIDKRSHIITSATEHKCVHEVCARAKALGTEVTILPVNSFGQVEVEAIERAIRPETVLVSVIYGNNEIGSINPIEEIARLTKEKGILLHVDAAQTVGKIEIDVHKTGIDLLSLSGHKIYGPKGIGALFVRQTQPRVRLEPQMVGGGQERGLRAGTPNVPGIVGLGAACALAREKLSEEKERLTRMRDGFIQKVITALDEVFLNGHPTQRLCNNISLSIAHLQLDQLLLGLNTVAFSTGSACSSGHGSSSHVLQAIGRSESLARSTIRLGLGRFTTQEEVDFTAEKLITVVQNTRKFSRTYKAAPQDSVNRVPEP